MNWQDYISIIPGVRSGKPCVKGTRITVSDVLEYLASGMDEQAILADFPELRREHSAPFLVLLRNVNGA